MNDNQIIEQLLTRQESNDLDFKSEQYSLDNDKKKSEFIKDILAMANTPRDKSAYILLGVRENAGKATEPIGVSNHHDESALLNQVAGRVRPTPKFSYRQISYKGVELGIIEIPATQPGGPFVPLRNFGVINEGAVYWRVNATNVAASGDDLRYITGAFPHVDHSAQYSSPSGAWEQLAQICDGFDAPVRIALLDREVNLDERDWDAFGRIHWNAIIDFDVDTDTEGNYSLAKPAFSEHHALQLSTLDAVPEITARSTVWIAANGLRARPTTTVENARAWNRRKSGHFERIMDAIAAATEPEPALVVVFSGDAGFVGRCLDIIDKAFEDRAGYVVAAPLPEQYSQVTDGLDASVAQISLPAVCEGLRNFASDGGATEIAFPKLDGGTVAIPKDRVKWIEEHLELVHLGLGVHPDANIQSEREVSFLKGAVVSWEVLDARVDAEREISANLSDRISRELADRGTRRVVLRHWPGAGASTVARRIAWDLRKQYPTVVVRRIHPEGTAERLRTLFGLTHLPVLTVIDLPGVNEEDVDRLYAVLRNSNIPVALFSTERSQSSAASQSRGSTGAHYLASELNTSEAYRLSNILSQRVPDERKKDISELIQKAGIQRTPFYFGLTAYGSDFRGIEPYVKARFSSAPDVVQEAVLFIAFAYYYGQITLPMQVFSQMFGISPSKRVSLQEFPSLIRELLVEEDNNVRPAHQLIAEEILKQGLVPDDADRRNWRNGLADLAVRFIDILATLPHSQDGAISEALRSVLINREPRNSNEFTTGWQDNFSQFIKDIPSSDGGKRVLEHLTEYFPEEPHFWAHLGRFYSLVSKRHSDAHHAYQQAIALSPDDSLLRHMAGMGWRAELYDKLASLHSRPSNELKESLFELLDKATSEFKEARRINRIDEYNYISQIQMIHRFVGSLSRATGYAAHETIKFLTLRGNDKYRELVDEAQNLLSDLDLVKGNEAASQRHHQVQADLKRLYGKYSEAIQGLNNLLDRADVFKPPVRRAIIRATVDRREGKWDKLSSRELARVVELANANFDAEPGSDYNMRIWLRAARTQNALSVDTIAERLAYKRLQNPSPDTAYYLYIMKFLQLDAGDLAVKQELPRLMEECQRLAAGLQRTTTSFEWFGNGHGLGSLVHSSTLGEWDEPQGFFSNSDNLRPVRGLISEIRHQGSGYIELRSGLRAFFVPSRGRPHGRGAGGYVRGDINREVEFFLGFSYDGLRAWSVRDPGVN